ncbi:MAG: hypothetical protein GC189_07040 [Alphaproteobacteria bacterium]|nr:hypothetical protein [Alphaproteobacteria bacterium]
MGMVRSTAVLGMAAALAACATAPSLPLRRESLARQISDDAAAFNDAYGRAVTAQILLNVLRSRDRLPRFYLSMTGIQDSPSLRFQENIGAGSIPLGEGSSPWGFGNFGLTRETQSRPSYAVQPFSAETLTRTAFQPIAPDIFGHYWSNGWPRDLLTFVLVERISKITPGADGAPRVEEFVNEANNIRADCADGVDSSGCGFVREARAFLASIEGQTPQRMTPSGAREVCGLVEAYAPERPVQRAPGGEQCDPRFVVGGAIYVFHLRSLDDCIYYVGELMRGEAGDHGAIEAPLNVRTAGLRGGGSVPLFRMELDEDSARRPYAASVEYAGKRYWAGPAVSRSCYQASERGPCRDDAEHGDRSSSVLSLLAEVLALNQSPDAIRAPNRLIAE